jgi:hypothetical protein
MSRVETLRPQYVDTIPSELRDGVIYICERYQTASHRCCCGCGTRVVTPLRAGGWTLRKHGNTVSLSPSIGNWNFPCRSHYWIRDGRVEWSLSMTDTEIARNQIRDRDDLERAVAATKRSLLRRWWHALTGR